MNKGLFRAFFTAGVSLLYLISTASSGFLFAAPANAQTSCQLAMGIPFRSDRASTVYVVNANCQKQPIFNEPVYFSHFRTWGETRWVSQASLDAVANAPLHFLPWGPLRAYPDGSLVKVVTDDKVYLLESMNAYPIKDEATFFEHGFRFADVLDVMPEVLARYPMQNELTTAASKSTSTHSHSNTTTTGTTSGSTTTTGGTTTTTTTTTTDPMSGMDMGTTSGSTTTSTTSGSTTTTSTGTTTTMNMGSQLDLTSINAQGYTGLNTEKIGPAPFDIYYTDGVGAFRSQCQFAHMKYDDPMVFPGQAGASHLHTFFGNASADASTTESTIRAPGTYGTCAGGSANLSGYWVPTLLDSHGVPQIPTRNMVYYKSGYGGIAPKDIQEFPVGLRMIAGSAKATSTQENAYWGCAEHYIGHLGSIPTNCPDGTTELEMTVEFPQCWNGKDLDSPDHKSHMAYPVDHHCPADHPVPIPAISFNVRWNIPPEGAAGMRLSSDMYDASMPGGFSAHGDWWDGWDHAIVKKWMANCVNAGLDCRGGLISNTEYLEY